MSHEKLVHMANQIAGFFKSQPQDTAIAGVAEHINSYWEPRMRNELFAIMDQGGEGLSTLVMSARRLIRIPKDQIRR